MVDCLWLLKSCPRMDDFANPPNSPPKKNLHLWLLLSISSGMNAIITSPDEIEQKKPES